MKKYDCVNAEHRYLPLCLYERGTPTEVETEVIVSLRLNSHSYLTGCQRLIGPHSVDAPAVTTATAATSAVGPSGLPQPPHQPPRHPPHQPHPKLTDFLGLTHHEFLLPNNKLRATAFPRPNDLSLPLHTYIKQDQLRSFLRLPLPNHVH